MKVLVTSMASRDFHEINMRNKQVRLVSSCPAGRLLDEEGKQNCCYLSTHSGCCYLPELCIQCMSLIWFAQA